MRNKPGKQVNASSAVQVVVPNGPVQDGIRRALEHFAIDGWQNIVTSLGVQGKDGGIETRFAPEGPLDYSQIQEMYRSEGLARKIVDFTVREMFRRGFEVVGDTDGVAVKYMHEKRLFKALTTTAKWGRLYGGAIGVGLLDDGREISKRLDENNIRDIHGINVFDRWRVTYTTRDLYLDPESPKFLQPRRYYVTPIQGMPFYVHESRVVRYDGAELPEELRLANAGWHDSVLQAPYSKLRSMANVMGYSESVIKTFVTQVFSMDGMSAAIAAGNDKIVQDRFNTMRLWMSALNIVPVDIGGEKYEKSSSTVTGLPDMISKFQEWLASDGCPVAVLFGRSAGGLNATGDSDFRILYDGIREEAIEKGTPMCARVVRWVQLCKKGPFRGKPKTPSVEIEWLPMMEPSEKEQAETRLAIAKADDIYLQSTTFDPTEIAESRAGGGKYSPNYSMLYKRKRPTGVPDPVTAESVAAGGAGAPKKKPEGG